MIDLLKDPLPHRIGDLRDELARDAMDDDMGMTVLVGDERKLLHLGLTMIEAAMDSRDKTLQVRLAEERKRLGLG